MLWRCLILALVLPAAAFAAEWRIDPGTRVVVDVGWRGTTVTVQFPDIDGEVTFDEQRPELARAEIRVETARASTGLAPVDRLVRSEGYLDAAHHPAIIFHLDSLVPTSRSTARINGRITLRGQTRPAEFSVQVFRYGPAPEDPARFEAGFDVRGEIDRTEFGSTAGLPDVPAILPVRVRLLLISTS
jgi:polyisoprenoid-binding protein YceI